MKQASIKLKKVRNDVSRFNMDDKFATCCVKNLTLWGLINSKITTVVSLDRKSKYQIGSDQNRKHRVWVTSNEECHTVDHSYSNSELTAKLCPLAVASVSANDESYLVSEDKNLPLLKQKYDINKISYHFEERPFKPFAVVFREDVPFEKESAASNFNLRSHVNILVCLNILVCSFTINWSSQTLALQYIHTKSFLRRLSSLRTFFPACLMISFKFFNTFYTTGKFST